MAKYTTGSSEDASEGDTCELCGTRSDSLRQVTIAGASLLVCPDCAPHDDTDRDSNGTDSPSTDDADRSRSVPTSSTSLWEGDTEHWEQQGTDYDADPLPYLVSEYGDRVRAARQEAGFQVVELAAELDVSEDDLLAVEQGRAARANVGGSVIKLLEEFLDIKLAESTD